MVPIQGMPGWMQPIAEWNPVSAVAGALRELFGNPNPAALRDNFPSQNPVLMAIVWSLVDHGDLHPDRPGPAQGPHRRLTRRSSRRTTAALTTTSSCAEVVVALAGCIDLRAVASACLSQAAPHPLHHVGWSDRVEALFAAVAGDAVEPARRGQERGWCRVATPTGERSIEVPGLAVGDWVALDGDAVREVLPRWSELARLGPEGNRQVLATNLDLVLIAAPADRLSLARWNARSSSPGRAARDRSWC